MTKKDFTNLIRSAMSEGIDAEDIADAFGTSIGCVKRWERGVSFPVQFVRDLAPDKIKKLKNV